METLSLTCSCFRTSGKRFRLDSFRLQMKTYAILAKSRQTRMFPSIKGGPQKAGPASWKEASGGGLPTLSSEDNFPVLFLPTLAYSLPAAWCLHRAEGQLDTLAPCWPQAELTAAGNRYPDVASQWALPAFRISIS